VIADIAGVLIDPAAPFPSAAPVIPGAPTRSNAAPG